MNPDTQKPSQAGIFYAIAAYGTWGFFPLYWKLLEGVEHSFILAHRMLWSLVVVLLVITAGRQWAAWATVLKNRAVVLRLLCGGVCIGANWYIYIMAVNTGHVLASSLGYFMNPIINVVVGVAFLKEKLSSLQWCAVLLALGGVVNTAFYAGTTGVFIALSLAVTFCLYGIIHKLTPVGSLVSFATETLCLFPVTVCYLVWQSAHGAAIWGHQPHHSTLLALGGVVTTIPLLFFTSAATRLPLSVLGFFQYISPMMQFFLGIYFFHEPLTNHSLVSFALVWSALMLFTYDGGMRLLRSRHRASNLLP